MDREQIFWDRLVDMPLVEAEQELVLRREEIAKEESQRAQRLNATTANSARRNDYRKEIAASKAAEANLTKINERIKYYRKLQDRLHWRNAVREFFGDDAVTECLVWMEQQRDIQ